MDQNTDASQGAGQGEAPKQDMQADINRLAAQAKAASQGFDFMKMFEGRIGNMHFLYFVVAALVASFVLGMIPLIGWIISLALAVIGVGVGIRRFHDIHITGWASLIFFVPLIGFLAALYLCWRQGDPAANQYGPVPDPKRDFFKAVLNT